MRKTDDPVTTEQDDWSFEISNKQLLDITELIPIDHFCVKQHLQYLAHICRMVILDIGPFCSIFRMGNKKIITMNLTYKLHCCSKISVSYTRLT